MLKVFYSSSPSTISCEFNFFKFISISWEWFLFDIAWFFGRKLSNKLMIIFENYMWYSGKIHMFVKADFLAVYHYFQILHRIEKF